jgi:hypothetical protein
LQEMRRVPAEVSVAENANSPLNASFVLSIKHGAKRGMGIG